MGFLELPSLPRCVFLFFNHGEALGIVEIIKERTYESHRRYTKILFISNQVQNKNPKPAVS